jgi:hypothetical protein
MERKDVMAILVSLISIVSVPVLYKNLETRYLGDFDWTELYPSQQAAAIELTWDQQKFKRNFTLQIRIEDYTNVENVQVGFSEWVDGEPQPVTNWIDCEELGYLYVFPDQIELIFEYSGRSYWQILGDNTGVLFDSSEDRMEFCQVDLNFRISKEAYGAIYENKIKTLQIIIDEIEPVVTFVWEGPLHEVPPECLLFKGFEGRPVHAKFPLNQTEGTKAPEVKEQRGYTDVLALEIIEPSEKRNSTYYLMSGGLPYTIPDCMNETICGNLISEILDAGRVFAGGKVFNYISPVDGEQYCILVPTSIWTERLPPPEEQATRFLINRVGEKYFERHLTLDRIEINQWEPEEWLTRVVFQYNISVGDYSRIEDVSVYFDLDDFIVSTGCVPAAGNLMPFNITREEAVVIGLLRGSPTKFHEIVSEIYYWRRKINGSRLNKYAWVVQFYLSPRNARSGHILEVVIDVHTGKVYGVERVGWEVS